jgi:hypothetical protein
LRSCKEKGDALYVASQHELSSAAGRFLPKLGGAFAPPFFCSPRQISKKAMRDGSAPFQGHGIVIANMRDFSDDRRTSPTRRHGSDLPPVRGGTRGARGLREKLIRTMTPHRNKEAV